MIGLKLLKLGALVKISARRSGSRSLRTAHTPTSGASPQQGSQVRASPTCGTAAARQCAAKPRPTGETIHPIDEIQSAPTPPTVAPHKPDMVAVAQTGRCSARRRGSGFLRAVRPRSEQARRVESEPG
jgi:hypothetical protein